jgi:hypothetical protein
MFSKISSDTQKALITTLLDHEGDLLVLMENDLPMLCNRAFCDFFDIDDVNDILRQIGKVENRFVPHDTYFHAGKMQEEMTWYESIVTFSKADQIVSMLNAAMQPHAFEVDVTRVDTMHMIRFRDVTQTLIKRILIENDASINKKSGAYSKEYFMHTAQGVMDATVFNEKGIGITIITRSTESQGSLEEFTNILKRMLRSEDMLIHWSDTVFVLLYMIDHDSDIQSVTNKLRSKFSGDSSTKLYSESKTAQSNLLQSVQNAIATSKQ